MNRFLRFAIIAALSIIATVRVTQTLGATYDWNATSGSWNVASEWSPSTVPGPADFAFIAIGGTANIGASVNASCGTLVLGGGFGGAVQLASGNLTVGGGGELVGYGITGLFDNGSGLFNQIAGTNSTTGGLMLGPNAGSSGTYNLSGGSLTVSGGGELVGDTDTGQFNQTAGTNSATSYLSLGTNASGSGSYTLGGGLLTVGGLGEYVGDNGYGTFTQTAGTNSANGGLTVGNNYTSSGTYTLSGGLLTAQNEYVGYVGSFTQSGGINSASGSLNLYGAYNLTGGTVSTPNETDDASSFTQSGGVHLVTSQLIIGNDYSSSYNLSGSGVLSAPGEIVGNTTVPTYPYSTNNSTFTQSGGTNLISGNLVLGNGNGGAATGSYYLSGGLLRLGGIESYTYKGASFTFGGGTIQMLAGFGSAVSIDLNVPGSIGTLDSYGNTLTFYAGELFGSGGVNKVGAGALILNGTQGYTGPTIVSGGTLEVLNDFPTSSFTATGGGTLQFAGTTLNLNTRVISALAGGTVVYQNASVNGGILFGPGTHILPAGSATTFNTTTINPGTVIQEAGNDTFFQATDRGTMTVSGSLTIIGGINDGGANMTVNGTADVSSWSNAGVITITSSGLLNNHVSDLTSYGGARIYVNNGGTLNANSQGEGTALDLQDSLLVNNGHVTGTTNVYYGATLTGSGSFGPINILGGGTMSVVSPAAEQSPGIAAGDQYLPGVISGGGTLAVPINIVSALTCAPSAALRLTLSGAVTGSGSLTESGPGTLVLSDTNTYSGGTIVAGGTLIATNNEALADRSNLTVGNAILFDPVAPASEASAAALSTPATVPEPSTFALLATGVVLLVRLRRCRIS